MLLAQKKKRLSVSLAKSRWWQVGALGAQPGPGVPCSLCDDCYSPEAIFCDAESLVPPLPPWNPRAFVF